MACRTLLRRRAQLDLLAQACQQQVEAQVVSRRDGRRSGRGRLVGCESAGLTLRWLEAERLLDFEVPGHPVEVRFECHGQPYRFCTQSEGRLADDSPPGGAAEWLRLRLPLSVEPVSGRRWPRIVLPDQLTLRCRLTHVMHQRPGIAARVTDIAAGGFGAVLEAADLPKVKPGDLFRVRFEADGAVLPAAEFVVRLVYLRPLPGGAQLAAGWALQPADDASAYRRLSDFIQELVRGAQGRDSAADNEDLQE